jgi:hypothetical protein
MKTNNLKKACAIALSASMCLSVDSAAVFAQDATEAGSFETLMEEKYADPEMQYRPYARWWLAEGSHTDETLIESIHELYDAGYGGIEFVTLDESNYLDDETYAWGSDEWIHDSQLIIKECQKLGMSVSMTSGTHWSTANLTVITPDDQEASQELGYTVSDAFTGSYQGELALCELPEDTTKQTLVSVVAAKVLENETLDIDSLTVVDAQKTEVDGFTTSVTVDYTAPDDGNYVLFAFYQYGTGESYKPATTGKAYTINYLDKCGSEKLIEYWDENVLTPELQEIIDQIDECDMYMDSLELQVKGSQTTGQLWSTDMLQELETRAGYDMEKYLPLLIIAAGGGFGADVVYTYDVEGDEAEAFVSNLQNDFYQVQTDLYTENCLEVLSSWLHGKNMKLRAENSYGKLFETSEPIRVLDYVETEAFEFGTEIDSYRNMSGGAHVYDKRFSSETGAAVCANYLFNNGYYRQMFYMQYASGIQKTITHGYSSEYGPDDRVSWPGYEGMMDMFSERFNKRQPGSLDYTELNQHLSRIQEVLEQGVPQMDVLMLRTDYNLNNWSYGFANGNDVYNNMIHQHQGIYWQDMELQDAGYTYEYLSPYCLTDEEVTSSNGLINADGVAYQSVIIMEDELPYDSAVTLLEWAKDGLPIVFVNNVEELVENASGADGGVGAAPTAETAVKKVNTIAGSTTGSNDGKDAELAEVVAEMKELPNVVTVESEADAYEALQSLNVRPRAEYVESNDTLLSVLRKDGDVSYLYVYNYMYQNEEAYTGQISLDGNYQPYELNTWDGDVQKIADYSVEDGRTTLNLDIAPGEVAVYILNSAEEIGTTVVNTENVYKVLSEEGQVKAAVSESGSFTVTLSDGSVVTQDVEAPEDVTLSGWNLTVDSYTPGEKVERTEENEDTGVTTTEVTYATNHTDINVGTLEELVPWKDIEALGATVVGAGTYTTTFTLPEDWSAEINGAVFSAGSFNYGTAAVWVNGERVLADMDRADADISSYVQPGENTIEVRVTSSLRNIMIEQGYESGWFGAVPEPDDYGMTGETKVVTYSKVDVAA